MSTTGSGYGSDVDWNTVGKSGSSGGSNTNQNDSNSTINQFDFWGFLSYLQILSVQETLASTKPDENIVTIGKVMNGIKLGFGAGVWMSLLMFFYVIAFFYFSSVTPRLSPLIDKIILYIWIVFVTGASMWMGYFSRYVTGAMTKKLTTSLFAGKMIASLLAGGVLVFLMLEAKDIMKTQKELFANDGMLAILKLDIDFILKSYPEGLSMLVVQILVSAFLAFVMLQFRHFFISGDMKKHYDEF